MITITHLMICFHRLKLARASAGKSTSRVKSSPPSHAIDRNSPHQHQPVAPEGKVGSIKKAQCVRTKRVERVSASSPSSSPASQPLSSPSRLSSPLSDSIRSPGNTFTRRGNAPPYKSPISPNKPAIFYTSPRSTRSSYLNRLTTSTRRGQPQSKLLLSPPPSQTVLTNKSPYAAQKKQRTARYVVE